MFTNGRVLWKSLIILGHSKNEYSTIWTRGLTVYKDLSLSAVIAIDNAIFGQNSVPVCVLFCHSHRSYRYLAHSISREQLSWALIFCLMNFVRENKSRA